MTATSDTASAARTCCRHLLPVGEGYGDGLHAGDHVGISDDCAVGFIDNAALEVADELGARSVAFPLISTGVYGWPRRDAIAAAIETIAAADTRVEAARLVAFEPEAHEEVRAQLTSSNSHRGTGIKYEGN